MKMTRCRSTTTKPKWRFGGSSLVETLLAVGILGTLLPPVFGLLALGLVSVRNLEAASAHALLVPKVLDRLADDAWPPARQNVPAGRGDSARWRKVLYYDDALRPTQEPAGAAYRVDLAGSDGVGWVSPSLEAVHVRVIRHPGGQPVGTCVLHRHRASISRP